MAKPKAVLSSTEAAAPEHLPTLYEVIPRLGRDWKAPTHLDPLVRSLERSWTEPVFQTAHAPPRHAKTDTVLGWIALTLKRFPWETIAYVSFSSDIAKSKSRRARQWALALGVKLADDAGRMTEWRTREGGGLLALGIEGGLTSQGVHKLIIDDPYKNRQQAESAAYRQQVADWWGDVGETRIEPGGSAFIFHTRWNPDDLISHVLQGEGGSDWQPHIRLPAIDEQGRALWPSRWPAKELERKRRSVGELTWASLYQGLPRPRGGAVFNGTTLYKRGELDGWDDIAIGVDLAYSSRKASDYSIAVVLARKGTRYFVLRVLRRQVPVPVFQRELAALVDEFNGPPVRSFIGGTELGVIDLLAREARLDDGTPIPGVHVDAFPARADKLVRAQPAAAAWNRGDILVPAEDDADVSAFVSSVLSFTGVKDKHDDDVDALGAAYDALDNAVDTDTTIVQLSTR